MHIKLAQTLKQKCMYIEIARMDLKTDQTIGELIKFKFEYNEHQIQPVSLDK